jgi:hypothetical protein
MFCTQTPPERQRADEVGSMPGPSERLDRDARRAQFGSQGAVAAQKPGVHAVAFVVEPSGQGAGQARNSRTLGFGSS